MNIHRPHKACPSHSWSVIMWPTFPMSCSLFWMLEKARQYDGPLTFPVDTPVLRTVEVLMIPLSGFTEWVRILQCLKDWQMGRILFSLNRLHSQCNWKKKRAKRPIHQILPSIFGEATFYILYEVNVPCFWLQNSDWHINQIIKVREGRTAKETAAALLLLAPFRI